MLGLKMITVKDLEPGDEIIMKNSYTMEYLKVLATPSSQRSLTNIKCSACVDKNFKHRVAVYEEDVTLHNGVKYLPPYEKALLVPKERYEQH